MKFGQWVGFTLLIFSLYIFWEIRQLILLLFTALILAEALSILVLKLQEFGLKRSQSLLISVGFLFAFIIGAFWLIIPPFIQQIEELVKLVPAGIAQLITTLQEIGTQFDPELIQALPTFNELIGQLQPLINQIANRGLNIFYTSLGMILSLVLLLALTLMLLANPTPYRQGFIRFFPSFYRERVDRILVQCDQTLTRWLIVIMAHMIIMTLLSWIGLLIFGIPLAFSQALLSGALTFIPNLGPVLAMIPPIAIALLEASWKPWAVIILYTIIYITIQQLDKRILASRVLKQHICLLPGITLLAQIFFASLFGFLGLLLALPLFIVSQIWIREALVKDILDHWRIS
ncbi:protein of unknown function UPF0118 [Gloeothece citriformis PCC 7424]|uniref:Permease n=1 Tax=Gloeothece citriformis (strain PCC 7424) TaxID=65393 RepID=B7KI71_GLOC7|nr:AI-2E family transporter [Gloeothece citriformis]ACK73558.1 protein of unknown function UPF0118 [Gloeothece citriformis PCC 7424]